MGENKEIIEADPITETEIELAPDSTGVVAGVLSVEDQLALAENIVKLVEAQNKIRMALLGLAQIGDWVVFGDEEKVKAELNFAGAMRIGSTLGCSFMNWSAEKETGTDERGTWFRWNYECDAVFRGRTVRVYGRASSRDKFFGKAHGKFKQVIDVDEGDIRMAARRGAMKEGVKVLFGLHHMDPAELSKVGVRLEHASNVKFQTQEAKSEETKTVTIQVKEVTMKKGATWVKYSIIDTNGEIYSTFSETFATVAKAAKESGGKVNISYIVDKFGNQIKGIENA